MIARSKPRGGRYDTIAAAFALMVGVLDALQPLLLAWRPKFYGSIAGAISYVVLAFATVRSRSRVALIAIALMPIVPLTAIVGNALGAPLPVDREMIAILFVQLTAAGFASAALRR